MTNSSEYVTWAFSPTNKMLDAIFLIETAKDTCIANDFCSIECVLNYSLNIIYNIHNEIELMHY